MLNHLEQLAANSSAGSALPSTRTLARELGTSPVTISRAIAALVARGIIVSEVGRGTYTALTSARPTGDTSWQPMALPTARVDPRSVTALDPASTGTGFAPLSSGYLDTELQPRQALQAATSRTMRRGTTWATAPAVGLSELRAIFAAEIGLDQNNIIVSNGSQPALALVLRAITAPGDSIAVENPTYSGALAAIRSAGLSPVPVPTDREGIRPADFDTLLGRSGARVAYLQTAANNPTGASLSAERRIQLLAIAQSRQVLIIDDDWARHLTLDRRAPRPLITDDPHGHVIHLCSLSKSVAPSLRIGYIAARGPAFDRLRTATIADNLFVARPLQEIALEFLGSPEWPRHLKRLRRALVVRRDALLGHLSRYWPAQDGAITRPLAGYHLWLPCPEELSSTELTRRALEHGVIVGDGAHCYPDEPATQHIRVSFGALNEAAAFGAIDQLIDAIGVVTV